MTRRELLKLAKLAASPPQEIEEGYFECRRCNGDAPGETLCNGCAQEVLTELGVGVVEVLGQKPRGRNH